MSYGTLGPSLTGYGKARASDAGAAKAAYTKIYNAEAIAPCSNMPRFGHAGLLDEKQIRDVMGLLLDPRSPLNQ